MTSYNLPLFLLSILLLVGSYFLGTIMLIAVAPRRLRGQRDSRVSDDFSHDRPGFDTPSPRP